MNTIHKQYLVAEQQRLNPLPAHITKKANKIVKYKFALLEKFKKVI